MHKMELKNWQNIFSGSFLVLDHRVHSLDSQILQLAVTSVTIEILSNLLQKVIYVCIGQNSAQCHAGSANYNFSVNSCIA